MLEHGTYKRKTPDKGAGVVQSVSVRASKVIVHAETKIACLQPIIDTGDRISAAAEIHVEVLDLC